MVQKRYPRLLHDFSIEVYEDGKTIDDAELCYSHVGQATKGSTEMYICNTVVKGRHVRITINGPAGSYQLLILCEVRVFGTGNVIKSSFQQYQDAELSDLPDMTYSVQGYGQCAMKCYVLPMCHLFSVKLGV
ncbi:hypothetical protein LOTGIDRAFT_159944 [Lottia gigantea]|uniref:Uncharacterized protein n=1 Tax=Lottia gigantea TaxID=225164 RepID=V3ZYB8_LOTGI|nr:hypothetical protein LOTGIDRAFT_159944 [Lottia gigantea]ESO96528.1 hypothetical protein LOTGIDRAFT_159944 [Lottia gigantea]